jgi:hypothetical protein
MRVIEKIELKMGMNRVEVKDLGVVTCATDIEGKAYVLVEVETEETEKMEMGFLVTKVGEEIDEKLDVDFLGVAHVNGGETVLVFEIL